MSAYVVENDTINRIVWFLAANARENPYWIKPLMEQVVDDAPAPVPVADSIDVMNHTVAQLTGQPESEDVEEQWRIRQERFKRLTTPTPNDLRKIAERLHFMNVSAVRQRYEDDRESYNFTYRPCYKPISAIQAVKSMSCLSYQCCEGNVPESPLYKALDKVIAAVCYHIVSELPEYEAAKWG